MFFQALEFLNIAIAMLVFLVSITVMLVGTLWLLYSIINIGQNRCSWGRADKVKTIFWMAGRILCMREHIPCPFQNSQRTHWRPSNNEAVHGFLGQKA